AADGHLADLVVGDADEHVAGLALRGAEQRLLFELADVEADELDVDAEALREGGGLLAQPVERLVLEGRPDGERLAERGARERQGRGKGDDKLPQVRELPSVRAARRQGVP